MNKAYSALVLAGLAALAIAACSRGDRAYRETRTMMGTYVTVTAEREGLPEMVVRAGVADAFAEIDRVDALMSTYKPDSQLSRVNQMAGKEPVRVDPEVVETVGRAIGVARMTGGGFDPTVGPLVRLWGIASKDARVPADAEIGAALGLVDFRQVELDKEASTVFVKKKGASLDLGGIAKGYAADRAVAAMKKAGIRAGIVAVAGDLRLFGTRQDGMPWRIGIQHPREKETLLAKVELTDAATSTSGDYERFFMKDGIRYHHILDPSTGMPARGLVSVSVITPESWLADALATGLFVMGPERAWEFAKSSPDIEVLLVKEDGGVLATGRFAGLGISRVELGRQ